MGTYHPRVLIMTGKLLAVLFVSIFFVACYGQDAVKESELDEAIRNLRRVVREASTSAEKKKKITKKRNKDVKKKSKDGRKEKERKRARQAKKNKKLTKRKRKNTNSSRKKNGQNGNPSRKSMVKRESQKRKENLGKTERTKR